MFNLNSEVGALALLIGAVPLLFSTIAVRRWIRKRRRKAEVTADHCVCGYRMDQLDTVRCPECGRVSGFDVTAEELELTPEQLRRAKAKRDARKAASPAANDATKES